MEIDDHHNSGLHGDSKECDVAHPNGDAEVVAKPILENQAASHGIKRREDEDSSFRKRMKDHVEQQEDHEKYDRDNELQPFFGADFEFVLSGPLVAVSRGKTQFFAEELVSLSNESPVVLRCEV